MRKSLRKFSKRWLLTLLLVIFITIGSNTLTVPSTFFSETTVSTSVLTEQTTAQVPENGRKLTQSQISTEAPVEKRTNQEFNLGLINNQFQRLLFAAIATLILIGTVFLLNFVFARIRTKLRKLQETQTLAINIQKLQVLSPETIGSGLLILTKLVRLTLLVIVIIIYLAVLPTFFPQTEVIGRQILAYILPLLGNFLNGILGYVPNLLAITFVLIVTHFFLKFLQLLFKAIEKGQLNLPGFYREWVQPTYKLTQVLTLALALALIFPHLPGFGSPAFQGISILIGALITLGGASTVSNLMGGFVTIYTRAFRIGDLISIGEKEYTGYVMEKTILSTRIRTSTNEIITIPNSTLIAGMIVNYTATLRDIKEPLILHAKITLGYDVPWRQVHEVLITAAQLTTDILADPSPIVWQKSLDDFYVSYELRASTLEISKVGKIYSEMYQNILDQCNKNGIEILSPHYNALRDGNQLTLHES